MISSLLIANRGEIARRIMRTAGRLGVRTVAVYSDADADAAFVREADAAVRIGPPPPAESYLKIEAILEAAKQTGAEAVHPGYGFLAENAAFAAACVKAGLVFVGPSPEAIALLGRKDEAKAAMAAAGVPVVPGYFGDDQSEATLQAAAEEIGYPVLLKAVAGGGGRGMRKVARAAEFADALASAKREAAGAFGDDRMLVEKLIATPRHIEVQVFGDAAGDVIHLYERDCSLQRRHQKVIEEAPAPGMTEEMRAAMCDAAVEAARAVGYRNAGTVEFIVDASKGLKPDGFFFMEMNTRLQVEHPVTEMVTGLDLVELQLRVASGESLPTQDQITLEGHAIEARICAEDPSAGWAPSAGRLEVFDLTKLDPLSAARAAAAFDLLTDDVFAFPSRVDSAVEEGDVVSAEYDSLIAKAIVFHDSREAAIDQLAAGLRAAEIWPVRTNAAFLARALAHPDFRAGKLDTGFIEARPDLVEPSMSVETAAMLTAVLEGEAEAAFGVGLVPLDPWDGFDGWRMNAPARTWRCYEANGARFDVAVTQTADGARVACSGEEAVASVAARDEGDLVSPVVVEMNGVTRPLRLELVGATRILFSAGEAYGFHPPSLSALEEGAAGGDAIVAPMPGTVIAARAEAGDAVTAGQPVFILEAMKMEHALAAPRDGVLEDVRVAVGDRVSLGDVLARIAGEAPGRAE
ncbi:MAG: biotin carboxylase N-terminal domain-containing protein [Maricaulaceae bacterium]|jgi:3-methylcrotonyl-CoA carboxylase alpha subunit